MAVQSFVVELIEGLLKSKDLGLTEGDIKGVLKVVETALKRVKVNIAKTVGLLNQFGDLEAIRDHLILRPFNYDNNEKVLADDIYQRIGDMALVHQFRATLRNSNKAANMVG